MIFFFKKLYKLFPSQTVYAHCDVPCGIYDPKAAQVAAATVLKMVQKLQEYAPDDFNNRVRAVWTKEEHARKCKEELLILWTDYFKPEHLEKFPSIHDIFWKAAKLCSKNKQSVDMQTAKDLVKAVDEIADIFQKSKSSK
ncbi:MAG: superoxide dismutase, Ni [Candidatus Levyibacteriota bacterium]|nr:MAG: superoxide dismutase, Ni [Candidatus Levybacteria bacterium]